MYYPQVILATPKDASIRDMKDDFLAEFAGNRNRAQLLRVFLFNPHDVMTLAALAKRSGIRPQAAAKEIKEIERLGVIKKTSLLSRSEPVKRRAGAGKKSLQKVEAAWRVNDGFKHLRALSNFVHETSPVRFDNIMGALKRTGRISAVILSGTFMGDPSRPADIIVAADSINERRLETAIRVLEPAFGREIRYAAFTTPEFRYRLTIQDRLIRDTLDYPHLVLLDKTRLL